MENFNINLTIKDMCSSGYFKCANEKTVSITDVCTIIPLQDGFSLRVVSVKSPRVTFEIKKSYVYFIRFAYVSIDTNICLPCSDCCNEHILTIKVNSIEP